MARNNSHGQCSGKDSTDKFAAVEKIWIGLFSEPESGMSGVVDFCFIISVQIRFVNFQKLDTEKVLNFSYI